MTTAGIHLLMPEGIAVRLKGLMLLSDDATAALRKSLRLVDVPPGMGCCQRQNCIYSKGIFYIITTFRMRV
jgi:hypothetical protein